MSMSQTLPGQQSGVTEASQPYFGPPTREVYDPSKWGLVSAHAQEIILNPEAKERVRSKGTPAFFKPSASGNRLPAILKILHAIPLAHEALLNRDHLLPDYGQNSEWWDGQPTQTLRVVNSDSEATSLEEAQVVFETQRLIAFLDYTKRAYGNTGILSDACGLAGPSNQMVEKFLTKWHDATVRLEPKNPLSDIFNSRALRESSNAPEERIPFRALELIVDEKLVGGGASLYDAFDDLLWPQDKKHLNDGFLHKIADVFVVEATNPSPSGSGLGLNIPAVWYPDRYLAERKKEAKQMRIDKAKILEVGAKIDREKEKYLMLRPSKIDGDLLDAKKLLSTTSSYLETPKTNTESLKPEADNDGVSIAESDLSHEKSVKLAQDLRAIAERVQDKIQKLEDAKKSTVEKFQELSQLYTNSSNVDGEPPFFRYTLRGVATHANTVYVLDRARPDPKGQSPNTRSGWQWWKWAYSASESNPISLKVRDFL